MASGCRSQLRSPGHWLVCKSALQTRSPRPWRCVFSDNAFPATAELWARKSSANPSLPSWVRLTGLTFRKTLLSFRQEKRSVPGVRSPSLPGLGDLRERLSVATRGQQTTRDSSKREALRSWCSDAAAQRPCSPNASKSRLRGASRGVPSQSAQNESDAEHSPSQV